MNTNLDFMYKNVGFEKALTSFDKKLDASAKEFMNLVLLQGKNNVSEVISFNILSIEFYVLWLYKICGKVSCDL